MGNAASQTFSLHTSEVIPSLTVRPGVRPQELNKIRAELNAINRSDSAHKSGDAWVRIASSVQAWIVVHWEDPRRLEPIRIPAHLIPINATSAETARWKRCVPRLAPINVWISKGFYLHSLQLTVLAQAGNSKGGRLAAGSIGADLAVDTKAVTINGFRARWLGGDGLRS
jgi:hypothetical protein